MVVTNTVTMINHLRGHQIVVTNTVTMIQPIRDRQVMEKIVIILVDMSDTIMKRWGW